MTRASKNGFALSYSLLLFILCLISRSITQDIALDGENIGQMLFGVILIQCAVFLIPSSIYLRHVTVSKSPSQGKPSVSLCVSIALWGCISVLAAYSLLCPISFPYSPVVLSRLDTFYLITAYGLAPAFCEEIAFRYCLHDMLDEKGIFGKLITTSLLFSMIHFSVWQLPVLFFGSLILGTVREITKSVAYPIAIHFTYNTFVIFFSSSLNAIYVKVSHTFYFSLFFAILLTALFMLSDRMLKYVRSEIQGKIRIEHKNMKENVLILIKTVISPRFICCVLIFVFAVVYRAFASRA